MDKFTADNEKSNANLYPGEAPALADQTPPAAGFEGVVLEDSPAPAKKAARKK